METNVEYDMETGRFESWGVGARALNPIPYKDECYKLKALLIDEPAVSAPVQGSTWTSCWRHSRGCHPLPLIVHPERGI